MRTLFILPLCVITFFSCQEKQVIVTLSNSLDINRSDEPIVLSRAFIESKIGDLEASEKPVLALGKNFIPQQLDDLDGDGKWDELAAIVDIQSNETKELVLKKTSEYPLFPDKTNVYLGVDYSRSDNFEEVKSENRHPENKAQVYPMMYQMEGPAWENDKVGFRNYFDSRNGKDIYGKTTSEMTLKIAGTKGQDYHKLDDWGMDILKVGNSLGAGGVAIEVTDSLIRLGNTASATFNTLTEGPVRTVFDIVHKGWSTPVGTLDVTERITIWAGQYAFHQEIITERQSDLVWVTGLVNKYAEEMYNGKVGKSDYIATYAVQSENKDKLGMGLIVPDEMFITNGETPKEGEGITETYFIKIKSSDNKLPTFCFVSGWEKSDDQFTGKDGFIKYIEELSARLGDPLTVD